MCVGVRLEGLGRGFEGPEVFLGATFISRSVDSSAADRLGSLVGHAMISEAY